MVGVTHDALFQKAEIAAHFAVQFTDQLLVCHHLGDVVDGVRVAYVIGRCGEHTTDDEGPFFACNDADVVIQAVAYAALLFDAGYFFLVVINL